MHRELNASKFYFMCIFSKERLNFGIEKGLIKAYYKTNIRIKLVLLIPNTNLEILQQ